MRADKAILICLALLTLLAGCTPAPAVPTPRLATAQVLSVQISPTLRGLAPVLSECARQQWTLGLVIDERPASLQDVSGSGLALRWGAPDSLNGFAAVLGQETLRVVVHPENPVTSLTRAQLRAIYNGSVFNWGSLLQPACESCAADHPTSPYAEREIHAWAYNPGEDIQRVFDTAFEVSTSPAATGIAPSSEAARQAVAEDPQAIGFLPERVVDASVRVVELAEVPEELLSQPLLAIFASEPQGLPRQWLACVQEHLK